MIHDSQANRFYSHPPPHTHTHHSYHPTFRLPSSLGRSTGESPPSCLSRSLSPHAARTVLCEISSRLLPIPRHHLPNTLSCLAFPNDVVLILLGARIKYRNDINLLFPCLCVFLPVCTSVSRSACSLLLLSQSALRLVNPLFVLPFYISLYVSPTPVQLSFYHRVFQCPRVKVLVTADSEVCELRVQLPPISA